MKRHLILAAALIACLPLAAEKAQEPAREAEIRRAIATCWERLASWCVTRKLRDEARAAAGEALAIDPAHAKARAAREAADRATSEPAGVDHKDYEKKLASTRAQAAGLWHRLARELHDAKDDAAYDAHWGRALELDPKAIGPLHEAETRAALQKKEWTRAWRLLEQQEAHLPPDPGRALRRREVEARLSTKAPLLKKASTHELRYYLMLPEGWTPDRAWPVLVVCEGAGAGYEAQCARHAGFRKDLPVILMTPCTFANTNGINRQRYPFYPESVFQEVESKGALAFDDPGILAALEDLKRDYNAEDRFFITGFSGGGILAWHNVFTRPARLRGAFLANANFATGPGEAPEGGRDVPIRAFQGDKDGHIEALTEQWKRAEALLARWEYTNFSREILPGVGHTACHQPVFDAIREILGK